MVFCPILLVVYSVPCYQINVYIIRTTLKFREDPRLRAYVIFIKSEDEYNIMVLSMALGEGVSPLGARDSR